METALPRLAGLTRGSGTDPNELGRIRRSQGLWNRCWATGYLVFRTDGTEMPGTDPDEARNAPN